MIGRRNLKSPLLLIAFIIGVVSSGSAPAADVPGGLVQTGEPLRVNTFSLLMTPTFVMAPQTAYLSSQIRYQPNEDFGTGFSFGAGEIGFNFGMNGTWYVVPDTASQPAVGVLGGIYYNRFNRGNYFVVKAAPMVSKAFKVDFGQIIPYGGVHFTPSFRLDVPANQLSMKASGGSELVFQALNGLHLWTEVGWGFLNTPSEIVLGVSYPFTTL